MTTTKTSKTATTSTDTTTSSSTAETSTCSSTKSLVLVDYSDAEDDDDDVDKNDIDDQELLNQFNSLSLNTNEDDVWTIVKTQRESQKLISLGYSYTIDKKTKTRSIGSAIRSHVKVNK